ncbi:MAG TPA: ABC transporter permease [Candidatus Dormibacteraeota bacterium]|nr:ABC transporter permease [Candidatus Dormibacteraeota bacterium]
MSLLRTLETGLRGILGHRLRSVLTTLGILFGVAAVICTVGIGTASADSVNARIASLGTNLLTITPGSTRAAGVFGGAGTAASLTMQDVDGLMSKDNAPDVGAVAPVVQRSEPMVSLASNWTSTVQGSSTGWLTANARSVASGEFFTQDDVNKHALKIVLGSTTATNLGASVGDTITVNRIPFTVIGILNTVGGQGFQNGDDLGVVPITAAHDVLTGGDPNSVQRILLSATSGDTVGSAYQEADQLLLNTHASSLGSSGTPDFTIQAQSSFLSTAQSVTTTLTILLASVAAISLLVGGIGVMNIMLVSVTERTNEIGLRKALGATPGDLLRQFLVEASTLSVVGGLLGVGAGLLAGVLIPHFTTIGVTITATPVLVAVLVAAGVGLIFGVYPAARAARLAPIEALRAQ